MSGENRDAPTDEIGTQKEWDAKRAILVTRNLQASEGILQEPSGHPRPGDKRPASPPRDSSTTQQRERERKGTGRESSRAGDGEARQGKGAGKKGERLTSEGSIPGGRSSWDDYHGHPKSRPERPRVRGDERERPPRHGDDEQLRRSRSTRETTTRTGVRLAEAPTTRPSATPGDVSSTREEIATTIRHISTETGRRGKMGPRTDVETSQSSRADERTRDRRRESGRDRPRRRTRRGEDDEEQHMT